MLGWIIENTVLASGLAVVVGLVCRFNRTRPAFCHLLWLLVFGVLVLPPLPLGPLGASLNLRQEIGEWIVPGGAIETPVEEATPPGEELVEGAGLDIVERGGEEGEAAPLGALAPRAGGGSPFGARLAAVPLVAWALLGWGLGALALALRWQRRILRFHRSVRTAPPAPLALRRAVARVARRLGVRAPEVKLIAGVGCPSVWCFGRPRLLWPRGRAAHLDSGCEPSLIAHELAHLVRRDHWVSRFEVLATGLLWWNPLFWVIRAQVHYYAELSCDAWALWAYPGDRRAYAEALIEAQEKTAVAPVALHGLCATDTEFKDFERRLSMIMKKQVSRGVTKGTAALAILGTLLLLPAFAGDGQKAPKGELGGKEEVVCFDGMITAKKLYGKAEKLFAGKQWEQAAELYAKVLELEPTNGMAHSRLGYLLTASGRYDEAKEHFVAELKLGHNPPTATYNLACVASMSGEPKAALGYLEKAVRLGFDNVELMAKDTDLESIRETEPYEKLLKLATVGIDLRKKMEQAKKSGDKEAALETLGALTDVYSADGELQHSYGIQLLSAGYLEDAAQAFQRQAEAGFLPANGWYNTACAQARAGDKEGAIESLTRAAKLGMSHGGVLSDTDLSSLEGDPRFEKLKQVIATPELRTKKIQVALQKGDLEVASAKLGELLADPACTPKERGWASYELAKLQLSSGEHAAAIKGFETAARHGVQPDGVAFHLAIANAATGELKRAQVLLDQALDLGFADPEMVAKVAKKMNLGDEKAVAELVERAAKNGEAKELELKKKQATKEKKEGSATVMK